MAGWMNGVIYSSWGGRWQQAFQYVTKKWTTEIVNKVFWAEKNPIKSRTIQKNFIVYIFYIVLYCRYCTGVEFSLYIMKPYQWMSSTLTQKRCLQNDNNNPSIISHCLSLCRNPGGLSLTVGVHQFIIAVLVFSCLIFVIDPHTWKTSL